MNVTKGEFGGFGIAIGRDPVCAWSWWTYAPREHFTAQCFDAYRDHMKGSAGEKMVAHSLVNVVMDHHSRKKVQP
jgi:hypothetical protein